MKLMLVLVALPVLFQVVFCEWDESLACLEQCLSPSLDKESAVSNGFSLVQTDPRCESYQQAYDCAVGGCIQSPVTGWYLGNLGVQLGRYCQGTDEQTAYEFFNGVDDFTQALSAAIPQSGCVVPARNADEFCRVASCIWNSVYNFIKPNYSEEVAAWVGIVQKLSYAINQNDRRFPGPIPPLCYNWIFGPGADIEDTDVLRQWLAPNPNQTQTQTGHAQTTVLY